MKLATFLTLLPLALPVFAQETKDPVVKHESPPDAPPECASISRREVQQTIESETGLIDQLTAKLADVEAKSPGSEEAKELRLTIRDHCDTLDQAKRLLAQLIKTSGIIYNPVSHQGNRSLPLVERKILLETQLRFIATMEGEDLHTFVGNIDLRDNPVPFLHQRYLEATLTLDALRLKGLANGHPDFISAEKSIKTIQTHLDTAILAIRKTLEAELEIVNTQIAQPPVAQPPQQ